MCFAILQSPCLISSANSSSSESWVANSTSASVSESLTEEPAYGFHCTSHLGLAQKVVDGVSDSEISSDLYCLRVGLDCLEGLVCHCGGCKGRCWIEATSAHVADHHTSTDNMSSVGVCSLGAPGLGEGSELSACCHSNEYYAIVYNIGGVFLPAYN